MSKDQLTEADMADYLVTYNGGPGLSARSVRAAYVTADDKLPGMLAFKDHGHRTVALISQDGVRSVERLESGHVADKQITERAAAQKQRIERGFQPTSRVMEGM